ncbi:MAG: hypothetical protein RMJ15_00525 [Nitrososphaerota archaeon]|nr:hypothetical protein [Candidatus Bathyarchaeota archaeon]MDW8022219.1 hypothetical protein [Nitrososphaerota archaeon]
MEKKYKNLVKPLVVRLGPEGLYADQRFWMDSRDLEGFNMVFSYGFIKEPCTCHPVNGEMLVHPFDEVLIFAPCDASGDILDLNAEISIELGEENEEQVFYEPSAVVIPKGLPHGPVKVRRLEKPIVHYLVGLGPEYKGEYVAKKTAAKTGLKYVRLIKKFRMARGCMSKKLAPPAMARPIVGGPGNAEQIVWFYGDNLENISLNVSWGFYGRPGIWHRIGRGGAHVHPVDEALIFVGLDPDNLNYLGAEIEFALGEEGERHLVRVPAAVLAPKNLVHCPEITRWVDKPYGFIVCCLDAEHETTWLPAE